MDSTSYSAYATSSVCHIAVIAWCLWSVHELSLQESSELAAQSVEDITATSNSQEVPQSIVMMPDRHAINLSQKKLPPLPELQHEDLSTQFITPRLFQKDTSPNQSLIDNPKNKQHPFVALPQSNSQFDTQVFNQGLKRSENIDPQLRSISEYWHTINAIILSNQYHRIWKKRFHKQLPRHALLLGIGIDNSVLIHAELKRGSGNPEFDTLFMSWLDGCIQRREIHGPPVANGNYPVEFLIR
ncbi:MAG: hypothetical protein HRU15_02815 [Planctomycetes bacterium]|nr:hypothetical protein [Planctomycetota bacterium]